MPATPKKIYLFDLQEKLIQEFRGAIECAEHVNLKAPAIRLAAERGSVLDGRFYVGYSETFAAPKRKNDRNPLKGRAYNRDGKGREDLLLGGQMSSLNALLESEGFSPSTSCFRELPVDCDWLMTA